MPTRKIGRNDRSSKDFGLEGLRWKNCHSKKRFAAQQQVDIKSDGRVREYGQPYTVTLHIDELNE